MTINVAHLNDQGIDFAVFDADSTCHSTTGRQRLLAQLTARGRRAGLRIEKAALAFVEGGEISFFGTPDLVRYLATGWVPHWTHTIEI